MGFKSSEYEVLLGLFFDVIQTKEGHPLTHENYWMNEGQVLSVKLFQHLISAFQLYSGSSFSHSNSYQLNFIDYSSITIIMRSALENYLALHWIYLSSDESTSKYRRKIWEYGGLIAIRLLSAIQPPRPNSQQRQYTCNPARRISNQARITCLSLKVIKEGSCEASGVEVKSGQILP